MYEVMLKLFACFSIFISSSAIPKPNSAFSCSPDGFDEATYRRQGFCWKAASERLSFSDATSYCQHYGASLMIINTLEKAQVLSKFVKDTIPATNPSLWLSSVHAINNGTVWKTSNTPANFTISLDKEVDVTGYRRVVFYPAILKWRLSECTLNNTLLSLSSSTTKKSSLANRDKRISSSKTKSKTHRERRRDSKKVKDDDDDDDEDVGSSHTRRSARHYRNRMRRHQSNTPHHLRRETRHKREAPRRIFSNIIHPMAVGRRLREHLKRSTSREHETITKKRRNLNQRDHGHVRAVSSARLKRTVPSTIRQSAEYLGRHQRATPTDRHQRASPSDRDQRASLADKHQRADSTERHQRAVLTNKHQRADSIERHQRAVPTDKHERADSTERHQRAVPTDKRERADSTERHQRAVLTNKHQRADSTERHQRAVSTDKHQRADSTERHQRAVLTNKHQRADSTERHQRAVSTDKHQRADSTERHQRAVPTDKHERTDSTNRHQRAVSTDKHQRADSTNRHQRAVSWDRHLFAGSSYSQERAVKHYTVCEKNDTQPSVHIAHGRVRRKRVIDNQLRSSSGHRSVRDTSGRRYQRKVWSRHKPHYRSRHRLHHARYHKRYHRIKVPTPVAIKVVCPDPFVLYQSHCFYVPAPNQLGFSGNKMDCKSVGGHLASAPDIQKIQLIRRFLRDYRLHRKLITVVVLSPLVREADHYFWETTMESADMVVKQFKLPPKAPLNDWVTFFGPDGKIRVSPHQNVFMHSLCETTGGLKKKDTT